MCFKIDCFLNSEEKFNIKRNIHDEKGTLNHDNEETCEDNWESPEEDQFGVSRMRTYLGNLVAVDATWKDALDRLMTNNEKLVKELGKLNIFFDNLLASGSNGWKLIFSTKLRQISHSAI